MRGIPLKRYWIIGIAAVSVLISGIAGIIFMHPVAILGGLVFPFVLLYAFVYWLTETRVSRAKEDEEEGEENDKENYAERKNEVSSFDPSLENLRDSEDFLKESDIVREFMKDFGISRDKAQNLYDAGYQHWGDFSEAIPEDLVMVNGINPTISRRIISVVRSKL